MPFFPDMTIVFINSLIIVAAMTNMILYPIKFRYKCLLYLLFAAAQSQFPDYGQMITIFCVTGALLIIALSEQHRILNVIFASFGYMLQVFINHFLTIPLSIMGISIEVLSETPAYNIPFIILFGALCFASTYYLGRYFRATLPPYASTLPKSILLLFMVEVLASTIVFVANIIRGEIFGYSRHVVIYNGIMFGAFFFVTFVIFFLCMYIMKKNSELTRIQQEDKSLLEYMDRLEKVYQEMRLFKHDYINILSTMNHYIMEGDTKNLKEYFQTQILPDSERLKDKDMILAKLSNIKIKELKGLLYAKMVIAVNLQLSICLEVQDEIDTIQMQTLDLCKVIGIFLDNAIEAAADTPAKKIVFALIQEETHTAIIISNSTILEQINLQKINDREYSSKPQHSGLGLFSAKQILNKYDNVMHSTSFRNRSFTQTIHIMKN